MEIYIFKVGFMIEGFKEFNYTDNNANESIFDFSKSLDFSADNSNGSLLDNLKSKSDDADEYQKNNYFGEVEKGREMTFTEADSGNVNPNFDECEGFQCNCQTCVVVFEARLRGWNIEAMPFKDDSNADELSINTNLAWIDSAGNHPEYIYDTTANSVDSVYKFIDETVKPGERYTLEGMWKGLFNCGHIISVFREKTGNLVFYDPQVNKIYNERSFKEDILSNMQKGITPDSNIKLLRIDNLAIDKNFMDPLVRRSEAHV